MTNESKAAFVNAITFARLPLIFLWAFLAVWHEFSRSGALVIAAALAMLLAGLTDLWDGKLARKWGVVSSLGKLADPLMDKVFYIVAFPTLLWQILHQGDSEVHALAMLAFTVIYMLRDTWVTFLRAVGASHGADGAAMWLGKVRTALSFPGAGWVYAYLALRRDYFPSSWYGPWLYTCYAVEAFLALLTIYSLFSYTRAYAPHLSAALRPTH